MRRWLSSTGAERRGAGSPDPAIGDTICLAPPLMTPEATIDRIVAVVRDSLAAATA